MCSRPGRSSQGAGESGLVVNSRDASTVIGAPVNAVETVKALVREQDGHVSQLHCGHGVADALEVLLEKAKG